MTPKQEPTNPFSPVAMSSARPSSITSASSQQSLANASSYSHMSDTTLGDTSSSSSSPRAATHAEASAAQEEPSSPNHSFELPTLSPPPASITSDTSISFRAQKGYAHATWARTFHSRPELLITPRTTAEVQKAVCLARKCRRRLVTVGSGHSPSDLTCTSSWMMKLDDLSSVLEVENYASDNVELEKDQDLSSNLARSEEDGLGGHPLAPSDTHPDPKQAPPRYAGRALVQAGISLENLNIEVKKHGLTLPNLGSIHIQSLAGAIATATHGSSMRHGIISSSVRGLRIVLASGEARWCSARKDQHPDLFRAALVSLGALGVITEIEIEMAPARNIEWESTLWDLDTALAQWHGKLWTEQEFVRCWWMPYTRRLVVWKADKTAKAVQKPASGSALGGWLGFHLYQSLLYLANWMPWMVKFVEKVIMGLEHGFTTGSRTTGVNEQRLALLMDCLYSQNVNEWAVPFSRGPEAIGRLDRWLRQADKDDERRIPISNKGLYAHSPIEVRVGNTGHTEREGSEVLSNRAGEVNDVQPRAFLDPTCEDEPTLYLNATLYRPYGAEAPWRHRYYQAFEWLMKDIGGRPHWAKNFETVTKKEFEQMYGDGLTSWRAVRRDVDPQNLFAGDWHRRLVLDNDADEEIGIGAQQLEKAMGLKRGGCEEEVVSWQKRWSGGTFWTGRQAVEPEASVWQQEEEALQTALTYSKVEL